MNCRRDVAVASACHKKEHFSADRTSQVEEWRKSKKNGRKCSTQSFKCSQSSINLLNGANKEKNLREGERANPSVDQSSEASQRRIVRCSALE